MRERLGEHASFLGWLEGDELARAYASADIFLFPSATDTFGQVILEAQASGLPDVAVAEGGPLSLIEQRVSGLLCDPTPSELAEALLELAGSPLLRERLTRAGMRRRGAYLGAGAAAPGRWLSQALGACERPQATRARCRSERAAAPPEVPWRCPLDAHDSGPDDRRRAARRRARHLRALRADPRLARGPRDRAGHAAGHPRARPAPARRALAGDGRVAARASSRRRLDRPARLSARPRAARRPARARSRAPAASGGVSSSASTSEETGAQSRPAGAYSSSRASSRTASWPPLMRTPTHCAGAWPQRFSWWAGLLRVHSTSVRPGTLAANPVAAPEASRGLGAEPWVGPLAPA